MEITGRVIDVLPLQGGTSATSGKSWQLETFVLETLESYPRKVAIEVFGEQRIKDNPVEVGYVFTVSFDLESREYNGRWYTSARAWKVVLRPEQTSIATDPAPAAPAAPYQAVIYPAKAEQQAAEAAKAAPAAPMAQNLPLFDQGNALEENTELPFQ